MSRRITTALAALAVLLAVPTAPAHAATTATAPQAVAPATLTGRVVETVATAADLRTDAYAQPGEGVIRITTRVCGNANSWQAVAAANGITATSNPPYLVLLGQRLSVSCSSLASTTVQPAAAGAASTAGWINPTPGACITSPYGQWRGSYAHQGVDLGAGYGTPIHAATAGTVVSTTWNNGGGNMTVLGHGGGLYSVYMHQSRFGVSPGQQVAAGQTIGYVGSTGDSSGPHLHFEIQPSGVWGSRVDPVSYLAARGVRLGC